MVLSLFSGKARADLCVLNSGRSCAEVNRYHVFCFCCVYTLVLLSNTRSTLTHPYNGVPKRISALFGSAVTRPQSTKSLNYDP